MRKDIQNGMDSVCIIFSEGNATLANKVFGAVYHGVN